MELSLFARPERKMISYCFKLKRGVRHPHQESQASFSIQTACKEQQVGAFKFQPVVQSLEMPFRYAKSIQHALKPVPSHAAFNVSAVVCTLS